MVFSLAGPRCDSAEALDRVFFALSDRTRRDLLERLRGVEENAGALARGFAVTRPAVSRHLRILREAALVRERRLGRERLYTLVPERLSAVDDWLSAYRVFWAARLHGLKALVESLPDETPAQRGRSSATRTRRARRATRKNP